MSGISTPSTQTRHYTYAFGGGTADGDTTMKLLLGGKGADLCEMSRLGLPVPPGFIVSTEACTAWRQSPPSDGLGDELGTEVREAVASLEQRTGRTFGPSPDDEGVPLLVSVRSGAPVSMPGMMDTVLNLGLTPDTVEQFARATGNTRLAWDAWRRFLQMYGSVVLEVDEHLFDEALARARAAAGVDDDTHLGVPQLQQLAVEFQSIIDAACGPDAIPADPADQLEQAITAVFASWDREPARVYRSHYGIPDDLGTAVNVQMMVFGNAGDTSASGVLFTRDPATGERLPYGEYLQNAQGEDVVSGMRTPQPVGAATAPAGTTPLQELMPATWERLLEVIELAEQHYRDAQDMEFCVESGELWMLQTRAAKRTSAAAVRIAVEMVEEGLITREEAIRRVDPDRLDELLVPSFVPDAGREVIGHGMPASPGAATGELVTDAHEAEARAAAGHPVILARGETSAADIAGMVAAAGVLTARGGATSHAAVVARGMGRPCVTACEGMSVDEEAGTITIGRTVVRAGDPISIDGSTGEVMLGEVPTRDAVVDGVLHRLLEWADDVRTIEVRANADNASGAERARELGARGIGLCRTEHMFFEASRLPLFVQTIMSNDESEERALLEQLSPQIESDLEQMLVAMSGLPVTIRLLDPPLHEFLPSTEEDAQAVADAAGVAVEDILATAQQLAERNPMLGLRGVRLSMLAPVIYEMQVRWIARAAQRARAAGADPRPAVMVPLVMVTAELQVARERIEAVLREELGEDAASVPVGSMLEVPSACLNADQLAPLADFFSFGTNDLTQLTLGLSRDDAESFLPSYVEQGLLPVDPFLTIDTTAVVPLMADAVRRARHARPDIEIGACGEHAGDPASIAAMQGVGLHYVSCSPLRVPAARLAGARLALDAAG